MDIGTADRGGGDAYQGIIWPYIWYWLISQLNTTWFNKYGGSHHAGHMTFLKLRHLNN
jgi:hypothetical protein